jgi:hypothetical protein
MTLITIPVINGTIPNKFLNLNIAITVNGYEWWRAFDGNIYTFWNAQIHYVTNYLLITFNDVYLMNSLQLTIYGDYYHDPKTIDIYLDENAMCLSQTFSFPYYTDGSFPTYPVSLFDTTSRWVVTNQLLLGIDRWSTNQVWLFELSFFGALY